MTPEIFVPIIVAIITVGGGGSIWQWLKSRKEAPITKRDADIAAMRSVDEMRQAFTGDVVAQYNAQRAENKETREQLVEMKETLAGALERLGTLEEHTLHQDKTIRNLGQIIDTWVAWGEDIVKRWNIIRMQDRPPDMPAVKRHQ